MGVITKTNDLISTGTDVTAYSKDKFRARTENG